MTTTTVATGIPHQRGTDWESMYELVEMEADSTTALLVTAAICRILSPTFYRGQNAITAAAINGRGAAVGLLAEMFVPCTLANAAAALTLAMSKGIRATFDPARSLEGNFQAACRAAGLGTIAEADAFMRGFLTEENWQEFATMFPTVRIGIGNQEEATQ